MGNCQMCESDKHTEREQDWTSDRMRLDEESRGIYKGMEGMILEIDRYLNDDMMYMKSMGGWIDKIRTVSEVQVLIHSCESMMKKSKKYSDEIGRYRSVCEYICSISYDVNIDGDTTTIQYIRYVVDYILKYLYAVVRYDDSDNNRMISEVGDNTTNIRRMMKDSLYNLSNVIVANIQYNHILHII